MARSCRYFVSSVPRTFLSVGALLCAGWCTSPPAHGGGYTPLATIDLTGVDPVQSHPYGIAFLPGAAFGYVALAGTVDFMLPPSLTNGRTIAEIDLSTLQVVRTFPVGLFPTELAVAPDGSELVAVCSTDSTLYRIDLASGSVAQLAITDSGGTPVDFVSGVALSTLGQQVIVTSSGANFDGSDENLVVVDLASWTIVHRETIAGAMSRLAMLSDGRAVIPVGFPGNDFLAPPQVRVYDTSTIPWTLLVTHALLVDTTAFPAPIDVALALDQSRAYISVFEGSSEIFVLDLTTLSLLPPIDLPLVDFAQHGLGMHPDGQHLIVTDFFAGQARVVEIGTGTVTAVLPTGAQPNEVGVHGGRLWITNQAGVSISVIALPGGFVRGDANEDDSVDVADAIRLLEYLFAGAPATCLDALDVNDNGSVLIDDPITLLAYLFSGGPAPAYPYPQPGQDLTTDGLGCP